LLGVPPERVIDLMALRGDAVDNIPGAPGIGEKGSTELIQRWGSLDNLLDHAQEVEKKSYRESLLDNREIILLSRKLATINQEVEIDFAPTAMKSQQPDADAARSLFTELEFSSLVKEFLTEGVEIGTTDYRRAESAEEIDALLASRADGVPVAVALDVAPAAATSEQEEETQARADKIARVWKIASVSRFLYTPPFHCKEDHSWRHHHPSQAGNSNNSSPS